MSLYLCPDCGNVYDDRNFKPTYIGQYEYCCPKADCRGRMFQVDELILPVIIELNKKGYITSYCCSGHVYEECPSGYISFDDSECAFTDLAFENIGNILKTYKNPSWHLDVYGFVLRSESWDKDKETKAQYVFRINQELLEIVKNLPDICEY